MALQAFGDSGGHVAVGDVALRHYVTVTETATVADVASRLRATGALVALVTRNPGAVAASDVIGVITRHHLGDAVSEAPDLFGA
jgi:CBS domain-containing protein